MINGMLFFSSPQPSPKEREPERECVSGYLKELICLIW